MIIPSLINHSVLYSDVGQIISQYVVPDRMHFRKMFKSCIGELEDVLKKHFPEYEYTKCVVYKGYRYYTDQSWKWWYRSFKCCNCNIGTLMTNRATLDYINTTPVRLCKQCYTKNPILFWKIIFKQCLYALEQPCYECGEDCEQSIQNCPY
jgi:hypothetical protein